MSSTHKDDAVDRREFINAACVMDGPIILGMIRVPALDQQLAELPAELEGTLGKFNEAEARLWELLSVR